MAPSSILKPSGAVLGSLGRAGGRFTCKFTVTIDVGRLGVPAGGLRTFWTNGPSVFYIFDKAWNRREEGRRGRTEATGRCGRRRSDDKIPEDAIFVDWSLRFLHF